VTGNNKIILHFVGLNAAGKIILLLPKQQVLILRPMARPSDIVIAAKLEKMDGKLDLILLQLKKLGDVAAANVTPELEDVINRARALSLGIDRKVPDKPQRKK
jgi:hypothetical protein